MSRIVVETLYHEFIETKPLDYLQNGFDEKTGHSRSHAFIGYSKLLVVHHGTDKHEPTHTHLFQLTSRRGMPTITNTAPIKRNVAT